VEPLDRPAIESAHPAVAVADPLQLPDRVRCGMVLPGGTRDATLQGARALENAGFDSLWVGDHVSFHIPVTESLTMLSFAAGVTERIRLGSAVYLLPLRHPTLIAKITSSLDMLSGGRLTLGVGVGGEFPPEFEAVGVPLEERGSRADEAIGILRRLWTEDGVAHDGKHFHFGAISIDPKPVQPGGPPIIVGGRRGATFRRAGQLGDGYVSHMCSTEQFAANMAKIRRHAERAGRDGHPFEPMSFLFTVFDDSYEAALDRATDMLQKIYRVPFRDAAAKYCLLGRPEDCLEQMQRFASEGSRHVILSVLSDPTEAVEIARDGIIPELHRIQTG
jgi:probable F420-dependent oxidoreductase